jgi:hypothetical protein
MSAVFTTTTRCPNIIFSLLQNVVTIVTLLFAVCSKMAEAFATKQKNVNLLQEYVSQRELLQESLAIMRGEILFALHNCCCCVSHVVVKNQRD